MLLRVFYGAWGKSTPFKKLVLEEIYIASNLNRHPSVSEIMITGLELEGAPPFLSNIKLCSQIEYSSVGANPDLDFYVEGDINYEGATQIKIKTDCRVRWPAFLVVPLNITINVTKLSGKIRLLFSEKAKSHLQFVQRPEVIVDVEPVIGDKI